MSWLELDIKFLLKGGHRTTERRGWRPHLLTVYAICLSKMGILKLPLRWHSWQRKQPVSHGVQAKFAPERALVTPGIRTGESLSLGGSKGQARFQDPERNINQLSSLRTRGNEQQRPQTSPPPTQFCGHPWKASLPPLDGNKMVTHPRSCPVPSTDHFMLIRVVNSIYFPPVVHPVTMIQFFRDHRFLS